MKCSNCHDKGHIAKYCPKSEMRTCHKCGLPGHISMDCAIKLKYFIKQKERNEQLRRALDLGKQSKKKVF